MTTIGGQATRDVCCAALIVVAAFKDDPVLEQLHPVQVRALDDLTAACRFLHELVSREPSGPQKEAA